MFVVDGRNDSDEHGIHDSDDGGDGSDLAGGDDADDDNALQGRGLRREWVRDPVSVQQRSFLPLFFTR